MGQATDEWLTMIGYGKPSVISHGKPSGVVFTHEQEARLRDAFLPIKAPTTRSLRLRIPAGTKRPDSFYKKVAELYTALTASGTHKPAQVIAEANDVPVTTVRRWIKEARARKVLAPADRAGRAG